MLLRRKSVDDDVEKLCTHKTYVQCCRQTSVTDVDTHAHSHTCVPCASVSALCPQHIQFLFCPFVALVALARALITTQETDAVVVVVVAIFVCKYVM